MALPAAEQRCTSPAMALPRALSSVSAVRWRRMWSSNHRRRSPPKTGIRTPGASDVAVAVAGKTGALPGGFTYEADTAPTITSITAQGTRPNEPQNFADLDEEVSVTAAVQDPDTPADRLTFEWSVDTGTINGTGATVTWRAPADAQTPKSVTITVKVSDPGSNTTTGTGTISLHNSRKEVGDLSRQFLLDFSDSNKDAAFVVRNFTKSPRCEADRDEEFNEIDANRKTLPHHVVQHRCRRGEDRVRQPSVLATCRATAMLARRFHPRGTASACQERPAVPVGFRGLTM